MIENIQKIIIETLEDRKATDIMVFDTSSHNSLFERLVIASANSSRQTKAIASHVRDAAKLNGATVISTEGEENGEWVLIDLDDIVVHVMQKEIRSYYRLEELWAGRELYRSKPSAIPLTEE